MRLPLDVAVAATSATLFDGGIAPDDGAASSTDTRTIEPGDTFVALHGERFDGHDFAAEAVRTRRRDARHRSPRCASSPATPRCSSTIRRAAYMALAAAARALFRGTRRRDHRKHRQDDDERVLFAQLLAVTLRRSRARSARRTRTTRSASASCCCCEPRTTRTTCSSSRWARATTATSQRSSQIARPQIGILTNIGDAHLEIMGSRERLEETKWALFSGGARAILNVARRGRRGGEPQLDRAAALVRRAEPAIAT